MVKLERDVERKFCQKMTALGWVPLKVEGPAGWPDRQLLGRDGFSFFVELKRLGGRLSEIQKFTHAKLKARGFIVETLYGSDDDEIARVLRIVEAARLPKKG